MRTSMPFVLLSVLSVIAVSGCTGQVNTGNGVVIEEFTPGFTEIYPGEPVVFYLKFRNAGSVDATNVFAEVLGLDEDWALSSSGIDGNRILRGEVLPRESLCQYDRTEHHTLMAPDMTYGTEGESATCTWMYRAPGIPEGMKPEYPITARVFYDYRTDVVKSFTLAPAGEMLSYSQQGRALPAGTVSSTRSPISISVESRSPIRFWDNGDVSFPVAITVSNKGGGMACLRDHCKKASSGGHEWNQVLLRITPAGDGLSVSEECEGFTGSGGILEVWPGRDNTIICNIVAGSLDSIVGHEERMIGISAEYGYFTDSHASITIL